MYLFCILVILGNIFLKFIMALLTGKVCAEKNIEVKYDIIGYTRLFFVVLKQIFFFVDFSFILVLDILLLYQKEIKKVG